MVYITAHFLTKHFSGEILISDKVGGKSFGVLNPNPIAHSRNYALHFITDKALLGQAIVFRPSLIRVLLGHACF